MVAIISVLMLTCSNSNPTAGRTEPENKGGDSCAKPAAPANVKAAAVSVSGIQITWNAVNDVDFYVVYRALTPDGTYSSAGRAFDASFRDSALTPATAYYYKIAAKNDCGEGAKSTLATATTMTCQLPATPTTVTAEAMSATSIKISWDLIPAATVYEVYRSASGGGTYELIDTTASRTYTNVGLQLSSTYYYKIAAKNDCGKSGLSDSASATTNACPKPAAPTNVSAEAKSSNSIEITWDEVNTAVTYKIYRSKTSTGTYSPVGSTSGKSSTSYTDVGLELTTMYYYKVAAESECETSAQSNYAVATTGCMAKPAQAPTNIRAEALSSTDIKISWDAVSDAGVASNYIVYRSESQNGYYSKTSTTPGIFTSMTITGFEPATTYFFKVSAENDCGESDMSTSFAYATTGDCDLPIPPSPTGISAVTASARRVTITWNAVDGASEYIVFRGLERYGSYSGIGNRITNTSFIDSAASPLTTYYYTVKSVNSCGGQTDGLDGDVVSVTTLCESPIPTNVEVTANSPGSLSVSWDAVSGAVSYSVYRAARNPNGQYTLLGKVTGANTTYTDTGLESLTSYYYKITAKTATCDDSGQSAYAVGTTQ